MSNGFPSSRLWIPLTIGAISSGLSYVAVSSFLTKFPLWPRELTPYASIGVALLIFFVVFYRIRRGTWTKDSAEAIVDVAFDD